MSAHVLLNLLNELGKKIRCEALPLRKRLRIRSVISVNYHCITVLCPFNILIRFKCYNFISNKFKQV